MTALSLPRNLPGRRKQSGPASLAKGVAKTWTSMKVGSAAARTAKKGAKAYGSWKVTKFLGTKAGKVLLVPVAVGGGVAAWRTVRSSSNGDGAAAADGQVTGAESSPQTSAAPKTAPGSTNGDTSDTETPAPPPGATS